MLLYSIAADLLVISDHEQGAMPKSPSVQRLQNRLRSLSSIYDDAKSRNEETGKGNPGMKAATELHKSREIARMRNSMMGKVQERGKRKKSEEAKRILTEQDIKRLQGRESLRVNVRNILGVQRSDDWVFSLNIGNVMHLIPLCF